MSQFKISSIFAFLLMIVIVPTASGSYDIDCEATGGYPSCCAAISDSHGSSAYWYLWSSGKGYYDSGITTGNYTDHHCIGGESGNFWLKAVSYQYNGPIFSFLDPKTGLISNGYGHCSAP